MVAQSRELVVIGSLFLVVVMFYFYGATFVDKCGRLMRDWIQRSATPEMWDEPGLAFLRPVLLQCADILWPFFLLAFCIGILMHVGQIGFLFTLEPLQPDFSRINPLKGIQRYFSFRGLAETAKSIVKLSIIGGLGYLHFVKFSKHAVSWNGLTVLQQVGMASREIGSFLLFIMVLLIGLAVLDFLFQKFDYERNIRMTRQEVKEETKMREGDPLIRARIRSIQRDRARRRMMQEVPKADVVITNPTHFAIALAYKQDQMHAPRVLAKGADILAQRIKDIARRHNIPIVENKPLARILYRTLKIGSFIPRELYQAVAEVLAYVYKLRGRLGGRR
jgi:flagellar biosynthetic protein FlhB